MPLLTEKKEKKVISFLQAETDTIVKLPICIQPRTTGMMKWVDKTREKAQLIAKQNILMMGLEEKEKELANLRKKEDIINTRPDRLLNECREYNKCNKHEDLKKLPSISQALKALEASQTSNKQHTSHSILSPRKKVNFDLTRNQVFEIPCDPDPFTSPFNENGTVSLNHQVDPNSNKFFKPKIVDLMSSKESQKTQHNLKN